MRQLAILFAVLLIAACPPRRGRVAYVRPCPQPVTVVAAEVVTPPPVKAEKTVDPVLAGHLAAWEGKAAGATNFRAEIELTRTDAVFKKATRFTGLVLLMKPNYAVFRLDNADDPTKTDYEAYICNGKAVYAYNGLVKTVTEFKLPLQLPWPFQRFAESLTFNFELLTGVKAGELHERFDITLFKSDENYLYLDIKPLMGKDQREFKHLRVAVYGPGPNTAKNAYLPAQVYVLRPNDDTEVWKFTNPQVDVPGVEAKHFQYVEIKDPKWKFQKSPREEKPAPPKP